MRAERKPRLTRAERKTTVLRLAQYAEGLFPQPVIAKVGEADPEKYELAAHQLFSRFTEQMPDTAFHHDGVVNGFKISARIAVWGMRAYRTRTRLMETEASIEELHAILSASYDPMVTPFSSTTHVRNRVLERSFGLRLGRGPVFDDIPFQISYDAHHTPILVPSPVTLSMAQKEPDYASSDEPLPEERCLASGKMLRKVWQATIDTCSLSEPLFPYDLTAEDLSILE